ncbi:MAG: hypothetical protein R6X32_19255 [Chloroflexota bacterium]|jgi:hypothetical protein
MYHFDLTTISGFLASLWALLWGVLTFDPDAYIAALTQPGGMRLSLAVLFLAGISLTLGRSVVLFANRVGRRRFILSLVLSALLLITGILFWAATVQLLANYLFGTQQTFESVLIVVSLSYAPLIYGVFILLPYLGRPLDLILHIWILLNVIGGVMAILPLGLWQALICCLLGWAILELVTRLRVVTAVQSGLWRLTTGLPELLTTEVAVEGFVQALRAYSQSLPGAKPEEKAA